MQFSSSKLPKNESCLPWTPLGSLQGSPEPLISWINGWPIHGPGSSQTLLWACTKCIVQSRAKHVANDNSCSLHALWYLITACSMKSACNATAQTSFYMTCNSILTISDQLFSQ